MKKTGTNMNRDRNMKEIFFAYKVMIKSHVSWAQDISIKHELTGPETS